MNFSSLRTAYRATTHPARYSDCLILTNFPSVSGALRRGLLRSTVLSRLTGRSRDARLTGATPSQHCTWQCPIGRMGGCDQRLVLALVAIDAKSNEITTVPKLLAILLLKGSFVTIDALDYPSRR
ncbi:MAG: hypothetical protein RLZZ366_925 [Pseudomonadota bacterium]